MAVNKISKINFEELVLKSEKPVLVDFWASWCGPCKMLSPIIEEIAKNQTDIEVVSINVDDEPEIANNYGVQSIPTLIAFKDGKEYNRSIGFQQKEQILQLFK